MEELSEHDVYLASLSDQAFDDYVLLFKVTDCEMYVWRAFALRIPNK